LKTPNAIAFAKEGGEPVRRAEEMKFGTAKDGKPAVTTITAPPIKAMVRWHLHTTNGVARNLENGQRTWPAKGGWSGVLTTGVLGVSLE
jgi:hypothetical protein